MIRVDVRPRHRNSGRADLDRRFPSHLAWLRKRPSAVAGAACAGRMEAAHIDHAGGKGTSLKVADYKTVPLCAAHHAEYHRGARSFEATHAIDLVAAAERYAASSPHRAQWAEVK